MSMNLKEILEILQRKKKENKGGVILICIASILAFVSAIYGAFQFGKKKGADEIKELRTRNASDSSIEEQLRTMADEIKAVIYKAVAPQPTYVVRPLEEKQRESVGKRFRRHMYAAASAILLISLVGSATLQYAETTDALAKESFSGIGKIVEDHDGEPYKILDIVPADAKYYATTSGINGDTYAGEYNFTLGTMGYLVNGQASVIKDLEENFKNNPKVYSYDSREELINAVLSSNSVLGLTYQEAYPGVDTISESAGWIQIFGEMDVDDDGGSKDDVGSGTGDSDGDDSDDNTDNSSDGLTYATGQFYGKYEPAENGKGDYTPVSGQDGLETAGLLPDSIYELHENGGAFRLSFAPMDGSEDMVGGYVAHVVDEMSSHAYSDTTCVYLYDESSGTYSYVGTIADIIGRHYDLNGGKKPEQSEEKPNDGTKTPEITEPETPEITEPETPEITEPETPEVTEPETPEVTEPETPEVTEPETPEVTEPETTDSGEPEMFSDDSQARAIVLSDDWRLLVEEDGAEIISITPMDDNSGAVNDEVIVDETVNTPSDDGEGTTEVTSTPSYEEPTNNGPSDDEIDWELYSDYKIVVFEYVEEPWEGETLYKVDGVEEINPAKGVPYPYDSYDINYPISTLAANINLMMLSPNGTTKEADWKFIYTPNKGTYNLVRLNENDNDAELIEVQGAPVYFRCTTDSDWIKEFVFCTLSGGDNKSDDFEIKVTTIRADQVTAYDVKQADLIFLESGEGNVVLNTGAMKPSYIGDAYDDMSAAAVDQILQDAVDNKPVIVDYGIVESKDHYQNSNYQYLAKAFLKSDLEGFYEAMNKGGKLLENLRTNKNVEDSKEYPNIDNNNYHYVNRNVYIVNGSPLVSEDFHDSFDADTVNKGFSEVLAAIKAENTTLSDDDQISNRVSKARAVQYIINYSVGIIGEFEYLRILEIQPSANLESDLHMEDNRTKLVWKTDSMTTGKQIFTNEKGFDVDIDVKSVVEFNSEWEDINGKYDMVFIGLDGQRLNRDNDGKTVYNDNSLNGIVYHSGDNSDSGLGRYDANDLTAQKMWDLLEFLEAGYPIVVENNCFEEGSAQDAGRDDINHDYIQADSTMERFLQAAVSDSRYYEYIFSVSDVPRNRTAFMMQLGISKPRISLLDEYGKEASRVQWLKPDENGEYHGEIYYKIESNRGGGYLGSPNIRLYIDYNYDGYFTQAEEVTEFVDDGTKLDVQIDGIGLGILPYKVEVSDEGKECRRDSAQGYFELGSITKNEMKVLQITEKKNNTAVDLQLMYDRVKNSMLAYYLHGVEKNLNTEMSFETVTASQLEARLTENAKYLEQWDVVVLTLDDAARSGTVAQAIEEYVAAGRSLLVCGQYLDDSDPRAGLSANLLGQTDGRTFVNIGATGAGAKLRYAKLELDMFGGQTGLTAEPVNDGSISFYPYEISENLKFGDLGALKAAPYLLDFDNNLKSESETNSFVTAWYTFGSDSSTGSAYGISPRDARNNYYCYSKGNVVYLAQSEYAYTYNEQSIPSSGDAGYSECRFFVNALFAAYSAGLHNAHINFVSGFADGAPEIESISVPFDEAWLEARDDTTGGILDNTVDVFFKFRDNNIVKYKSTEVNFYREASAEESGIYLDDVSGMEGVKLLPFDSDIWTVTDNRLVQVARNDMQPGQVYRIKAPVITLQNLRDNETTNKADIYIVMRTTFVKNGKVDNITTTGVVSLNRARLFRLE